MTLIQGEPIDSLLLLVRFLLSMLGIERSTEQQVSFPLQIAWPQLDHPAVAIGISVDRLGSIGQCRVHGRDG